MSPFTALFLILALVGAAGVLHTWATERRDTRRRQDAERMVNHLRRYP